MTQFRTFGLSFTGYHTDRMRHSVQDNRTDFGLRSRACPLPNGCHEEPFLRQPLAKEFRKSLRFCFWPSSVPPPIPMAFYWQCIHGDFWRATHDDVLAD